MTIEEVSDKYGVSITTLRTQFSRAQKSIFKKFNVQIIKQGRGQNATYTELIYPEEVSVRAASLFEESENFPIHADSLKLGMDHFLIFFAIAATPTRSFQGSFEEFCNYVQIGATKDRIDKLKGALSDLEEYGLINYILDKDYKNYFAVHLWQKTVFDYQVQIEWIKTCKVIADKENKREWLPLVKTYLAYEVLHDRMPLKESELAEYTNQSQSQISKMKAILQKYNMIDNKINYATAEKLDKKGQVVGYKKVRIGSTTETNAFSTVD